MRYFLIFILLGIGSASAETCPGGGLSFKVITKIDPLTGEEVKVTEKYCAEFKPYKDNYDKDKIKTDMIRLVFRPHEIPWKTPNWREPRK